MEIQEKYPGESTIVDLVGKLDASTTPVVEARIIKMIQEGKKYLILDFGKVTYLASSGLRMLLLVVRQIQKLEGSLVLCTLTPTMLDTLEVTGFLPYFKLASSTEEALKLSLE